MPPVMFPIVLLLIAMFFGLIWAISEVMKLRVLKTTMQHDVEEAIETAARGWVKELADLTDQTMLVKRGYESLRDENGTQNTALTRLRQDVDDLKRRTGSV